MLSSKTRSLNFNQTLDELLGTGRSKIEHGSLSATARPPTRHGRESISSSSEENRDPIVPLNLHESETERKDSGSSEVNHEEDEFLAKLNEIRRRSLVNLKDVKENQRPRQPSEITEEVEGDTNNNTSSRKPLSRSSTTETSHTYPITSDLTPTPAASPETPTPAPRSSVHTMSTPITNKQAKTENQGSSQTEAFASSRGHSSGKSQHEAWLKRKIEEERKRREKEKQEAKRKEEEERERREQAKKLFERWKRERDEKEREQRRQQRAKEKMKREAEEELKRERKAEADKSFKAWKRSHSQKRSQSTAEKERKKEEARKEAEQAFEEWKAKKDAQQLEVKRKAAEEEKEKKKRLEEEREYRELLARQTYEAWLEIKENERLMSQSLASLEFDELRLPWLPPSNTCPRRFTPSRRNRKRSLDGRPRTTSAQIPRLRRNNSVKTIFSVK